MVDVGKDPVRKIAITGGTGLIGSALRSSLEARGCELALISRSSSKADVIWDIDEGSFDASPLEGFDAIIHLAGEPIAQRWTGEVRERIYSSRINSTRLLVDGLSKLREPPKVFLSASGINYYPSTDFGAGLNEKAESGEGFLSRVCRHWEAEAQKAASFVPRVCFLRTAVVLASNGGALSKLVPVFKAGVGGRVGTGEQPFPWISIRDYVGACEHLLFDSDLSGPINLVAPERVDNRTFSKTLGKVLNRPAVLPVPKTAVKVVFGEMGLSTLMEGVDAIPGKLEDDGYRFVDPELAAALEGILNSE